MLEVDPPTDEISWEYLGDPSTAFYSAGRGCDQCLPNGNTLVTESNTGRLFEGTREGDIVWEWDNPDLTADGERMLIYRALRYSPDRIEP